MFPIYNNNKILNEIALYYKNNENYKFSLGPQELKYKGIYLKSKYFYIEHLSTKKNEYYWSNSLCIVLNKKYWSYYNKPDFIDDNFLIPKFGCGYFLVDSNYKNLHKKNNNYYDEFIIFISKKLYNEINNIANLKWILPKYIQINNKLKHNYDIVVKDADKIVGPLFSSNFPGLLYE